MWCGSQGLSQYSFVFSREHDQQRGIVVCAAAEEATAK